MQNLFEVVFAGERASDTERKAAILRHASCIGGRLATL